MFKCQLNYQKSHWIYEKCSMSMEHIDNSSYSKIYVLVVHYSIIWYFYIIYENESLFYLIISGCY